MRPSELAQVLRGANPWWSRHQRVTWVANDPELDQRDRHEWVPASRAARTALSEVGSTVRPGTATVLVGPRGVGKTTAAKDVVLRVLSDLLVDPRSILWVPVEAGPEQPERDPLEPADLDNALRRPTRVGAPACDGPRLIVLDEASVSEDWIDAVAGGAPNAQLLVTASVAGAVVEDLPARYPGRMSVGHLRPSTLAELLLAQPGTDPETTRTAFLSHGGYPRALAEYRDLGRVSDDFVELLEEGLLKDIGLFALHPCTLDEVIVGLCRTSGRFIEPAPLAAALTMSTAEVGALLDRMADAGVIDPRRGLVDPLLHQLPALHDPTRPLPTEQHVAAFSL
ncbi:MAG TPA: AAA family ATPase [Cellulomonas sp.]